MRILHVITRLIWGGAQKNTVMCCRAQVRAGHEVWLAFGPIFGPEGNLRPEAEAGGVRIEVVPSMRREIQPWHDWRCYRQLRGLIRRIKPDVVHTHSSKAGILGRAAAWAEEVPAVIHTVHGLPFHDRQPKYIHALYVHAERWAARRCHRLVGITQAMRDAFAGEGIADPSRFNIIPSGVEIAAFPPDIDDREQTRAELGLPVDAPVIGIVARLDPLKGHDDLLDILPTLRDRFPDVRLMFVGDGWHGDALRKRVEKSGAKEHVLFAGLVPQDRVPAMLRAMDVMALPSYQEGQGRTLVEALLCRCPIVGYAAGGIGEVCIDGKTGRLVPVGNRLLLAEAITWMIDHPEQRAKLAAVGRDHCMNHFTDRIMYERLEQVYACACRATATSD